jgi:hypothetical protein
MDAPLTLTCTTTSNVFYVPVPKKCKLAGARWVANQNQASTRTVVIAKTGGNTIVSGSVDATAGTVVDGTVTDTTADANQEIDTDETLTVTINFTGGTAAEVVMWLDLDEFELTH